jgi:plasmid stability protein
MASITIRNLDEALKQKLRERAAKNGHSMEQESRLILQEALTDSYANTEKTPLTILNEIKEKYGTWDFELPQRSYHAPKDIFLDESD